MCDPKSRIGYLVLLLTTIIIVNVPLEPANLLTLEPTELQK